MDRSDSNKDSGFYSQLVRRYADGGATEEELELFFHLLGDGTLTPYLITAMNGAAGVGETDALTEALAAATGNAPLHAPFPIRRLPRWTRIAAAVAILLCSALWFLLRGRPAATSEQPLLSFKTDIAPGGNKAVLTLANGQKIILDSVHTGRLAQQPGALVIKSDSGSLTYQATRSPFGTTHVQYNTLTTPRGGQYQLQLPDGSKVWLNAESSISYPTAFTDPERKVSITGEAYFEVARNPSKPFHVLAGHTDLEVLGTAFNINAYQDEQDIRTTLLSGAVRIDRTMTLAPGQQAIARDGALTKRDHAETDAAIAWKNGAFAFDDADLPEVMRSLARWYDLKIVYNGPPPQRVFSGKIGRSLTLAQVLNILSRTRVHYAIGDDHILTIAP